MSRCFPFPPPGYDKKIRIEEADSLIKEKQKKEKKHKKDKKKKDRKEKKDKETTSQDKQKEKKEKHKDRKDKDRVKEKNRTSEDEKATGLLPDVVVTTNALQNHCNGESKFVQDLARRIRDEEEATESHIPQKIELPENNISCAVPQTNHAKVDVKRTKTHRNLENSVLRVSSCVDQKGGEVMVKPVEVPKRKELQEKNHRRECVTKSDDKPLDKPKNTTDRSSKEKKAEIINKTVPEKQKFIDEGLILQEREHDSVDTKNLRVHDLSSASAGVKNLVGKRKDLETNGLLYENGFRPNKIQKSVASPISSAQNGRAYETHPESQGTMCNPEVKEYRLNGFIHSQEPKSHSTVKENGEASAKKPRPHSDLKYLDQILNVPKKEELHDVVDDAEQDWLFGESGVKLFKKQMIDSSSSTSSNETLQVWNQALRIESADIIALPYVVPF